MKLFLISLSLACLLLPLALGFRADLQQTSTPSTDQTQATEASTDSTSTESAATSTSTSSTSTNSSSVDSLVNKIYEFAAKMAKNKEDPEKRKLKRGIVGNWYPKKMQELLKKNAIQQKNQGYLLKYITEPFRFCVFPYAESNAMTYCDNTFKRISTARNSDCKHLMCINCCDHLLYILKFAASQTTVSETLGLSGEAGFSKMKGFITGDVIEKCRSTCHREYPVEKPIIIPTPPKDPTLGKTSENPAKSCQDIKTNGLDSKDGVYYLKSDKKPSFQAYCDMTTDGGGWTLFYSYVHHQYEEGDVDGTKLPLNTEKDRSHMNLREAGFDSLDVTELRFFCKTNNGPRYMHFKSHNPDLIETAMLGDQSHMKPLSWTRDKSNLGPPSNNKDFNLMKDKLPDTVTNVNKNKNGGFWDTPFASADGSWTIKGNVKSGGRWECGDLLDSVSGTKTDTVHQVWFRGQPPTKEFLAARVLEKTAKIK